MIHNPNCDGAHCRASSGPVRVYPLGGDGNAILCRGCFAHENRYRRERGRETGRPEDWPEIDWNKARTYP